MDPTEYKKMAIVPLEKVRGTRERERERGVEKIGCATDKLQRIFFRLYFILKQLKYKIIYTYLSGFNATMGIVLRVYTFLVC